MDLLVAREVGGHGAHVAGALHVVLPADGVHAAAGAPDFAVCHGDVRQRAHAVGRGRVLGHAQAVQDGGGVGLAVELRGGDEVARVDMADLRHALRRVGRDHLLELFEALGALGDELLVDESLFDEHVHDAVRERHVGARRELEMDVGELGKPDVAGVDHDELGALFHGAADLHAEDRVRLLGVCAHDHENVS